MTSPFRPNPAKSDYELQKLYARVTATYHQVTRVAADSHQPSSPSSDTTTPAVTYTLEIDPTNPHLALLTSSAITGSEHILDVPVSTLFVLDPTNGHLCVLPTLSS